MGILPRIWRFWRRERAWRWGRWCREFFFFSYILIRLHEMYANLMRCVVRDVKAYSLTAKAPPGEKQKGRAHEPEYVGMLILLVRLEIVETDLVVTINVPCGVDGAGDGERLVEMGREIRERVVRTLDVREWGLFGGE